MSVPILDDAYMERRAQEERLKAYMSSWSYSWGSLSDTPESLREKYARGDIDFEDFEQRLDRVLR